MKNLYNLKAQEIMGRCGATGCCQIFVLSKLENGH
jgi:hypothetical protein